ncbi:MAG: 50S ribosome-binding GTPase [Planctomycetota bacterium]|nr:50S ribosome-binding GTPase [Planctomycetota bacterium]
MSASRAILLTPPGSAAIAVIRLMGPAVGGFLRGHFSGLWNPGRPIHGQLSEGGRNLDDPVIVVSADGRLADVSVHGGPWVVRSVLELAGRAGFEVLGKGPLPVPLEAVDGETVLDREVGAVVPLAKTELGLRVLLSQVEAWREFCERAPRERDLSEQIGCILCDRSLFWLLHPPRVAIVGAPNVGKSTVANQLFGQNRSITADVPGTTRDWVGELANLDGLAVMLVDTPGFGATEDAIDREAIEHASGQIEAADLVVVVLDATQALCGQRVLTELDGGHMTIINKIDQPAAWDVQGINGIEISALRGEGIDEVRRAIREHFECEGIKAAEPRWWTDRQKDLLERAARSAAGAAELLSSVFCV